VKTIVLSGEPETARYGDEEDRPGPYSSIASVTLMVARIFDQPGMAEDKAPAK
jgi:hypothetical protein